MTVETFSVADTVSVTPAAAEHFHMRLQKSGKAGIRISLEEAGCTGFKYVIDEVNEGDGSDLRVQLANGVSLFIDGSHLSGIQGTQIDYVKEGLNRNLILNNPNVKDACGCGESFSV
ncbi:iron-sulfur cluster assembly accessory protein [Teredinibacter turnerae]|uniref:HesB/IscA family protein n=1 Tax=Teredinibacter turnerae TaxID=2426 RepID=UPI00037CA60C|nr:iron-sulfur cluster assembly accessory protein [Teredinibacter turnerae]